MNELEQIEEEVKKEAELKVYKGFDRVVAAQEKWQTLKEDALMKPKFRALTGIDGLDWCTEGFRKGQVVVLSGPPKNGKSQMCMTIANNMTEKGVKCLWLQYELTYEEFLDKYPKNDNLDFYLPNFMDSGNLEWVENRIIESKRKFGTEAIFIDHLDYLKNPKDMRRGNIEQNLSSYVGSIIQQLKSIAIRKEVIIFLMSHLKKMRWTSNDLPTAEDIRDSGQIPQLADIVMMIIRQRSDKFSDQIYTENYATLGVIENRHNGRTKKIQIKLKDKLFVEDAYVNTERVDIDF